MPTLTYGLSYYTLYKFSCQFLILFIVFFKKITPSLLTFFKLLYNRLARKFLVGYSSGWRGGFAKPVGRSNVPPGFESPTHRHSFKMRIPRGWEVRSSERSESEIPDPPPVIYFKKFKFGPIAQWLEQSAHNRLVPGSIPGGPTICYQKTHYILCNGFLFLKIPSA